ncbi:unnamed protein product, partial [Rotaria sordida]
MLNTFIKGGEVSIYTPDGK